MANILFVLAFLSAGATYACELRVGYEHWEPYIVDDGYGNLSGPEYDTLMALAKNTSCELVFVDVPWVRALIQLSEGKLDMLYGASRTEEREAFSFFSDAYRLDRLVLMVLAEEAEKDTVSLKAWVTNELSENVKERLGLIPGFHYGEQVQPIIDDVIRNGFHIKTTTDEQQLFLLKSERIKGYLINELAANEHIANNNDVTYLYIEEDEPEPMHLMFSRTLSKSIVEEFNRAIRSRN